MEAFNASIEVNGCKFQ